MIVNLSGRGDKDMQTVAQAFGRDAVTDVEWRRNARAESNGKFRELRARGEARADSVYRGRRPGPRAHARAGARTGSARRRSDRAGRAVFRSDGGRARQSARVGARARRGRLAGGDPRDGERACASETPDPADPVRLLQSDLALRMRAAVRRRGPRRSRRPAGRRSAARGEPPSLRARRAPPASTSSICSRRPRRSSACRTIARAASGFLYYVSVTGVTGARTDLAAGPRDSDVRELRAVTDLPIGVGFGISTPRQAREVAAYRRRGRGRQRALAADRASTPLAGPGRRRSANSSAR